MTEHEHTTDEADFEFWWSLEYDEELNLMGWIKQPDISPMDAAMLLCGRNPTKDKARHHGDVQQIARIFDHHVASQPRSISLNLQAWLDVARKRQVGYLPGVAQEIDVIAARIGLEARSKPRGGSENGTPSKLTAEQKAEIVKLYAYARGIPVARLARQFKVSRRTIDEVLVKADMKQVKRR